MQPFALLQQTRRYLKAPALMLLCVQLASPLLAGASSSLQAGEQRIWICTLQGLQSLLIDDRGQPVEQSPTSQAMVDCALTQLAQLLSAPLLSTNIYELQTAATATPGHSPLTALKTATPGAAHPIRAPPV
ncbi:hypothetical protein [Motiliproteus sediminis]|uniref:hypothetical protein n=1 Tax=Motiliproteus sediminis TaxID=1468178 RepID=UPI001AF01315|nr:hypothetical protein [Motiliproteus sediminis]